MTVSCQPDLFSAKIHPVFLSTDRKRLAHPGRAATEMQREPVCRRGSRHFDPGILPRVQHLFVPAASARHDCETLQRLDSPEKDCVCSPFSFSHNIATEMHPVGEVDIKVSALTKHDLVASGHPSKGVACRIVGAQISLHFDDPADEKVRAKPAEQQCAEEIRCDLKSRSQVETPRQLLVCQRICDREEWL